MPRNLAPALRAILPWIALFGGMVAAMANVTVTPASGGSNLSSDSAANAQSPAWTTLGAITVAEASNSDLSTGTGVTLVLKAPAGFEFNTAQTPNITFTAARNITSASIAVTDSTTLTVTLTVSGTSSLDTFTIGSTVGIQVRPTAGTPLATARRIYRPSSGGGTATIAGVTANSNGSGGTSFGSLSQVVGVASKLAFTTQPASATAGAVFGTQPAIETDDQFGNFSTTGLAASVSVTVALSSGSGPLQGTVTDDIGTNAGGGSITYSNLRIDASGSKQLTASATGLTSGVSSTFTVNPAAANKLTIQTQPSASATAGVAFPQQPQIRIEDQFGNLLTSDNSTVVTAARSGGSGTLQGTLTATAVGGVATFSNLSHNLANNITILFTATGLTSVTSGTVAVAIGPFSMLQLLLPGETAAAGTTTGKTGTPTAQVAGTPFTVTVNAVDAGWNVTSGATDSVGITSSDSYAGLPANAALAAGTKTFNVTLKAAGSSTVTASDITNGSKTANTSPSVTVSAGAFAKLQALAPGESTLPGSVTGRSGTPTAQTAASSFNVTVNAVDANWNLVNTVTDTVAITLSDSNATLPGNAALVAGTKNFGVTFKTGGSQTVTATDATNGSKSPDTSSAITVNAGTFTKLQLLVPGETAAPGTSTGKTGTPTAQTAGSSFNVTVNAVDANWNVVSSATDIIAITSSDTNAGLPSNAALVGGTKAFSVTLNTAGTKTLTASDVTNGAKTANTSPSITVSAGAFAKLQVLLPGESAVPGTSTGKTGTPTAQTAAVAFNVTVNAVDANWNFLSAPTDTVAISSSDANATLPAYAALVAGTRTFSVTMKTAASQTVTASDVTDGSKTADTSSSVTIGVGAITKLQLLVPGETAAPGTASGKTGSPSAQTAGSAFTVTVNAVDANWNLVSSTHSIHIISSDSNATLPSNAALAAGTKTFSVTLKTVGSWTVTATDVTSGSITANTSPSIPVNGGAFTKLQILLPGETAAPGTSTGKAGTPSSQTAGSAFTTTVNAVDANWNPLSTVTDTVGITSSDNNAALPSNAALVAGTKTFSVTLKTAGNSTVTGGDISDGSKTADTSPSVTVSAGVFTKLQVVAPGETAAPGSSTGKTGTPTAQTAGSSFNVTVNAVDANWNLASSTDTVAITSSDSNATSPGNAALVSGTKNFSVTFKTAGSQTVTATDATNGSKSPDTTSAIAVNSGTFTKLQLLVPGETAAPGTPTGKTGTPSARTAGSAFSVTVNAVDANWNLVSSATDTIAITSSDSNATLPSNAAFVSGTKSFTVTLKTAGGQTLTASDATNGAKTANTSPSITVNAGAFVKLQILVPGETAAPGTATGKTGTPNTQVADSPFTVTVNAVDANWNFLSAPTDTVAISSSDANATLPTYAALVAGTMTYTVEFNTVGSATVTASDLSDGAKTSNTSPSITVVAPPYTAATGGSAISADTTGGAYTSLTGPVYTEVATGDVATGTIIVNAPSGFIFDVGGVAPTVLITRISGTGSNTRNINSVASGTSVAMTSVTTTQLTFTVTGKSSNGVMCSLTWQNVRVRPTAGTPLASGSLTKTGTATMPGVSGTSNFGTLAEVAGAATQLTLQTQPSATATAGVAFVPQPVIAIKDQFGNRLSSANGNPNNSTVVTAARGTGTGTLQGTLTATAADGLATFANLSYQVAQTITINFTDGAVTPATSGNIAVSAAAVSKLAFTTQPGGAVVGSVFTVQPVIQTQDAFSNPSTVGLSANLNVAMALSQGTGPLLGTSTLDIGTAAGNGAVTFTNLRIDAAGSGKQITASATGLTSAVSSSFSVSQGNQSINFPALATKTYGDAAFSLNASASSGLPITFSVVSGPATVSGSVLTVTGAGTVMVRAAQSGDANYNAATPVDQSFTVNKASLTVTAGNKSRSYGSANPTLTASYSGFVNSDSASVLSGTPSLTTTAVTTSLETSALRSVPVAFNKFLKISP